MHELSVIKALIASLQPYRKQPADGQITKVAIEVGKMTCVDPEGLQFCFDMVKADAELPEVRLQINRIDGEAKCNQCEACFSLQHLGQPCLCGSYDYQLIKGEELNLTEVEYN